MRLKLWAIPAFFGAIVAAIPFEKTYETHLNYFPIDAEDDINSYLSLEWRLTNGSLYANNHRVFPPSHSMRLYAPRYESATDTRMMNQAYVKLTYSLQARPLSAEEVGATPNIIRVTVEPLDLNGMAVTNDAVAIDIHADQDGSQHVTRIHVDPATGIAGGRLYNAPSDEDSSRAYRHSPFWKPFPHPPPPPPHVSHHGPHRPHPHNDPHPHPDHNYVGLVRPAVLPALLGAVAGITACVAGYVIGQVLTAFWRRLTSRQTSSGKQTRRSRALDVEDGSGVEKSSLIAPANKSGPEGHDPAEVN